MKILLISHTSFSTYNNMGKTFLSLFSEFRKEELCQLYVYPSLPDVDVCNSYYRITDKEVLKNIFRFGRPGGVLDPQTIVFGKPAAYENSKDEAIYKRNGNNSPLVRLLRDGMWKISRWYSPALRKWVEQEKPSHIFVAPGYAKFVYDIALRISRDYHLPIITYICDDYYFVDSPKSLIGRIQFALLQKKTETLMKRTKHFVAICKEIEEAYAEKFRLPTSVIMTGAEMDTMASLSTDMPVESITYLGNVGLNRYRSLADVGNALVQLNQRYGTNFALDLYTPELSKEIKCALLDIPTIRLHGFVSGDRYKEVFRNSQLLLHVEAFDVDSVEQVKHSVSTKIAESLGSGIPMVAYGPDGIASIQHLVRNDCAFVATSREILPRVLEGAFFDAQQRARISQDAVSTAGVFHNRKRNSQCLRKAFDTCGGEQE